MPEVCVMTTVSVIQMIDINIISIIVLVIILIAISGYREKGMIQYKLFDLLLILGIWLNCLEICSSVFDASFGWTGMTAWWLNSVFNVLLYCTVPLPAAVWLLYAQYQIFHDVSLLRRTSFLLTPLIALNAFLSVLSVQTGWFFKIGSDNAYHRGEYFLIHVIIAFGILAAACLLIFSNRRLLEKRNFYALLLYVVPQVVGSLLQVTIYGLYLNWPFMMLSVLIVFMHIQSRGQYTDSLTGTYNQRHFEQILNIRINRVDEEARFALIMADIDDFRKINDTYGHKTGDEALQKTADILRSGLRKDDLIARIAGDRFYIMLEIADENILQAAVKRLSDKFVSFNQASGLPFSIKPSICGLIYDPDVGLTAQQFISRINQLINKEKARRLAESLSTEPAITLIDRS
jgi:diguanylate cyclase (GGDEF)-like protein